MPLSIINFDCRLNWTDSTSQILSKIQKPIHNGKLDKIPTRSILCLSVVQNHAMHFSSLNDCENVKCMNNVKSEIQTLVKSKMLSVHFGISLMTYELPCL